MPTRLGPKLNLGLVVFLLLLGAATAAVVLLGFERSQNNATRRSREGLETQGREFLNFYAETQSVMGQFQFASITEASQQAARIMFDVQRSANVQPAWDDSQLVQGSRGQWYDANPSRTSDVFIPNWTTLGPDVERDLRESAVLDGVFPAILARFPGQVRGTNFDAVAMYFVSVNGVVRYFPPDGFPERIEPDTHMALGIEQLGPVANPERKTAWSAPYNDPAGRGLVITAQTPVYDGAEFKGVIAVDLSMARLVAQLDEIHPTSSGFAFYIDSSGSLVESAAAPRVRAEIERTNPEFERVLHTMTWTSSGIERLNLDGRDVFLSYATLPDVGGRLALVAPIDELTSQAASVTTAIDSEGNRTVAATLAVTSVFFVSALAGAAYFNRRMLLRPIEAILAGTHAVGAGNLDARIDVRTNDELGELAHSFNEMTTQLGHAQQDLETRVEERTRELRALLDVSNTVSSTLDLDRLLGVILDQLKLVADYSGASVLVTEGDILVTQLARGPEGSVPRDAISSQRFPISQLGPIWTAIAQGEAVLVGDVHGEGPGAANFKQATGELYETSFGRIRSFLAVPLHAKDRVLGMLAISQSTPNAYDEHHEQLATAIGVQAGIAIENAYLLEQVQRSAALEERQRLARELHDSVSQALYGIALGARTARKRLETDPTSLAEPLDYVLSLAEAGLTEMRALIFELRPDSIETEGLVAALNRQIAAMRARYGVSVTAALPEEPEAPIGTKEALYRIAQEAMHNTVKHARASSIDLSLSRVNGHLRLEIQDDGMGFNPDSEFPGHLGLRSMRERMTAIGGTFEIWSAEGEGTRITAVAPVAEEVP